MTENISDSVFEGEKEQMKLFKPGDVVFDVGCAEGTWSKYALSYCDKINLHLFDALDYLEDKTIGKFNNVILSNSVGQDKKFYVYENNKGLSTCYRINKDFEKISDLSSKEIIVKTDTVDNYCFVNGIERIDYLKIDAEGSEVDVLIGSLGMITIKAVKKIQIEYGGTFQNAGTKLKDVFDLLKDYSAKKLDSSLTLDGYNSSMEIYDYSNYVFELKI